MQAGMRLPVHGASDAFGASLPRTVAPCSGSDYCRAPGAGRGRAASLTRPHRRTDWSPVVWKSQGNRCAWRSLALSPWVRSFCRAPLRAPPRLRHCAAKPRAHTGLTGRVELQMQTADAPSLVRCLEPQPPHRKPLKTQHSTHQLSAAPASGAPDTVTRARASGACSVGVCRSDVGY